MENRIPKYGSLVIGEVSKISPFGAYCKLIEYNNLEVFLPLREISSGWIKNIHEFLHINQRVVCKIIYIDQAKGTIDVSLKKVTPSGSKEKINEYNLEKRSEAIVAQATKVSNLTDQKNEIKSIIISEFSNYTTFLSKLSEKDEVLKDSKLPIDLQNEILSIIRSSRKEKEHIVSYIMTIGALDSKTSIDEIKNTLEKVEKETGSKIYYISAPKYHISAEAKNYPEAENKIKKAESIINSSLKNINFGMEKEKLKKDKEDIINTL